MTNAAKFTSGPWQIPERFHKDDELEIIGNIDGVDGDYGTTRVVFTSVARLFDNDEQEANARLIAAAPDLYEALDLLRIFLDRRAAHGQRGVTQGQLDDVEVKARKALSKAVS